MTARQTVRCALAISAVLSIMGCITVDGPEAPTAVTAETPALASQSPLPAPPGPKPAPPAGFKAAAAGTTQLAGRPPLPPMRPAFPRVRPGALDGLALERALTVFGKPAEVRRGPLVTTWTYAGAHCRLEIDFHFSVVDNAMRAHAARVADPAGTSMCLHDLAVPNAALAER